MPSPQGFTLPIIVFDRIISCKSIYFGMGKGSLDIIVALENFVSGYNLTNI
jgi:hypothetical protein